MKTCCIVSDRVIPEDKKEWVRQRIQEELELALQEGFKIFLSGFTGGADLIFAQCVIDQRREHPGLFLEAALPYANSIKYGSAAFRRLLKQCNGISIYQQEHTGDCRYQRDRSIVWQSHRLIAVCDGHPRGEAEAATLYARLLDKEISLIRYADA